MENKATRFSWLDDSEMCVTRTLEDRTYREPSAPDYSFLLRCVRDSSEEIDRCFRVWRRDLSQKRSGFSRRLPERQLIDLTSWQK